MSSWLLTLFLVLIAFHGVQCATRVGYYSKSCPEAESIIKKTVAAHVRSDKTIPAALVRLAFHDCFVQGCDGSILLDLSEDGAVIEKESPANKNSVRGFEVIDDVKQKLECACPGVVSCADIVQVAARDAADLARGPQWEVPTGRFDGRISRASETVALPPPFFNVEQMTKAFSAQGLNTEDLVNLLGAHTVGHTKCAIIQDRLYNFSATGKPDPALAKNYLVQLQQQCPKNSSSSVALDRKTEFKFDNNYYKELLAKRGALQADQALTLDASTLPIVSSYALPNQKYFFENFATSMIKMSNINVKSSKNGEIRIKCNVPNKALPTPRKTTSSHSELHPEPQYSATRVGFYAESCPEAESIVKKTVVAHFRWDKTIAPALLRLAFHDCFVRGCDGSILLDSSEDGSDVEKNGAPNLGSVRGYEVIDHAKELLEDSCPGVVSCADIVQLAARDSVFLTFGPNWQVPTGRLDGRISRKSGTTSLPGPSSTVAQMIESFKDQGLDTHDLVNLLGSHSLGRTKCAIIEDRLYNFSSTGKPDQTLSRTFAVELQKMCPKKSSSSVKLDSSEFRFDNEYFKELIARKGVLQADQELADDEATEPIVKTLSDNNNLFFKNFVESMIKMSNIGVKTASDGEIRLKCNIYNSL